MSRCPLLLPSPGSQAQKAGLSLQWLAGAKHATGNAHIQRQGHKPRVHTLPGLQAEQQGAALRTGIEGLSVVERVRFLSVSLRMLSGQPACKDIEDGRIASSYHHEPLMVQILKTQHFVCGHPVPRGQGNAHLHIAQGEGAGTGLRGPGVEEA